MKNGYLVGVGIGPGDPDLLTLKAVKTLSSADVICTPRSENSEDSIALSIIDQFCKGKIIVDMSFSMAPVHADRTVFWMRHALNIVKLCKEGKVVAFVTLGDPGLYSSFEYVSRLVRNLSPETEINTVPGITSVSASTAALGISLAQAEEGITIQPCSRILDKPLSWWKCFDTVVIMKIGRKLSELIGLLDDHSLLGVSYLVKRAGFSDASAIKGHNLHGCSMESGYLSTVIVRISENTENQENI